MTVIRAQQMRSALAALLIASVCETAHAAADTIVRPDPALQQLKFDAVNFESDLQQLYRALWFTPGERVDIDNSVNAPELQLQSFDLSIDGQTAVHQVYSHAEAIAFRSDGLQRVMTISAAPGTHRLHVTFSAMLNSGSPAEPTINGSFDQSFEKTEGRPMTLELALVRDDARSAPALRPRNWNDASGSVDDPRVRESIYLSAAHHYLFAAAADRSLARDPAAAAALLPLADALLDFGSRQQAESLLQQLAQSSEQLPALADARLELAAADYRSGDIDAAASRLDQIKDGLDPTQKKRWTDLETRVLLVREQYHDAIPLLRSADTEASPSVVRYNLAISLLNVGQTSNGQSMLDELGRAKAHTEIERSLRDKANLVLGYDYLRRKEAAKALPIFERVRVEGPYASRALLGLGWARYALHGHMPQQRWGSDNKARNPDDVSTSEAIDLPDFSGERAADINRALVPWLQLIKREPLDPAVQEALLAIPYALQKAGAATQSESYYAQAIATLKKTLDLTDQAVDDVRHNALLDNLIQTAALDDSGWSWQLKAMPASRSSWLLRPLIADDRFQVVLRDYRDARYLSAQIASWRNRLAALPQAGACHGSPCPSADPRGPMDAAALTRRLDDLSVRVEAAVTASRERARNLTINELLAQKGTTNEYQLQARMALSRLYDAPAAEDAQ